MTKTRRPTKDKVGGSGAIHFECPVCTHSHDRGYLNGVDLFRCLHCGYIGYGHHSDPTIDAEVQADIQEANVINRALVLPEEQHP